MQEKTDNSFLYNGIRQTVKAFKLGVECINTSDEQYYLIEDFSIDISTFFYFKHLFTLYESSTLDYAMLKLCIEIKEIVSNLEQTNRMKLNLVNMDKDWGELKDGIEKMHTLIQRNEIEQ